MVDSILLARIRERESKIIFLIVLSQIFVVLQEFSETLGDVVK